MDSVDRVVISPDILAGLRSLQDVEINVDNFEKIVKELEDRDKERGPIPRRTYSNNGRPKIVSKQTLQKLREAFLFGCSDEEASLYAGISKSTLYNFQNANPDFLEYKHAWKENPVMQARQTVYNSLIVDRESAMWLLERKKRAEFATRQELTGGEDAKPVQIEYVIPTNPGGAVNQDQVLADDQATPSVVTPNGSNT